MPFVIALIIVVGVVSLLDLLLTVGVIRRLRVHGELLAARQGSRLEPMLPEGEKAEPFSAVTLDGVYVSNTTLADPTLLGFFSPACSACAERLPLFAERARAFPGGRDHVLAVVVGVTDDTTDEVRTLRQVAQVVTEEAGGAVSRAFRVTGFPSFAVVDGSARVLARGTLLEDLDKVPAAR